MRLSSNPSVIRRMIKVEQAVKEAEIKLAPPAARSNGRIHFATSGTRLPFYEATPYIPLLRVIDELRLPSKLHFADLGSGLGMACFAAATYFARVTGFEIDPRLHAEAERIRQAEKVEGISFLNQDFMAANLQDFNVLYLFRPFTEYFEFRAGQKLNETKPGTVVISYVFTNHLLFNVRTFRQIYPVSSSSSLPNHDFFAFERI